MGTTTQARHEAVDDNQVVVATPPSSISGLRRSQSEHGLGQPWASSRAAWSLLAATLILGALVYWLFDALPFQDLPAHAGLIAMRHRFHASSFEQHYYVLAPHIGPYSLFRFLGEVFVRVSGPLTAVRVLGMLPLVATPLALLFARRRLYGERSATYGFVGLTLSFGIMTLLGFASYLLGVALMLVMLTLWLDLMVSVDAGGTDARRRVRKKELIVLACAPVMFVAHGHAFLLFLMCAVLSTLVVKHSRGARMLRLRALVPALILAGWVAWIESGGGTPPGSVARAHTLVPRFQGAGDKLGLLLSGTLMTRSGIDFAVGFGLLAFTVAASIMTVRSIVRSEASDSRPHALDPDVRHSRALYLCAAAILIVFLALPHAIGWFGFVDGRLVPVALLLALLGVRRSALTRGMNIALDRGSPLLSAILAILAMVSSYRFQTEARGYKEVLGHVPAESRLLNLPLDPNSDIFTAHPFVHYDKLVLVDRPIVVSDIWFHQGSALYPTPHNPVLRLPPSYSESNLKTIDWPSYRLEDWDFVLIRTRPEASQPWVPPEHLALESHAGGWWLFRRAN